MKQSRPDGKVRSEEPTTYNTLFDARQAFVNKQIAAEWLDLEKHVAWDYGYTVDQVVCRRNDEGWLLIIKAYKGKRVYASFIQADSLTEAFELGGEFASRGVLTWQQDEWPSKRLQKLLGIK